MQPDPMCINSCNRHYLEHQTLLQCMVDAWYSSEPVGLQHTCCDPAYCILLACADTMFTHAVFDGTCVAHIFRAVCGDLVLRELLVRYLHYSPADLTYGRQELHLRGCLVVEDIACCGFCEHSMHAIA